MSSVRLSDVQVSKGGQMVLAGVDLAVRDGEMLVIVGPSGSGKSTLLRTVAGLDAVDAGEVWFGDREVTTEAPQFRNVAMVFQGSILYPFLTAGSNVAFPLEVRGQAREEVATRVQAEGRALHIGQLFDRRPSELSAGHRQLVQIAKAMVRAPEVFLLDEPLAMLDAKLRLRMRGELRTVQRGYGVTTIHVTNDPIEAMAMADRVAVVSAGRVAQIGDPETVYHEPATIEIAGLMGELSLLPVDVESDGHGFWLAAGTLRVRAWAPSLSDHLRRRLTIGIRPDGAVVDPVGKTTGSASRVEAHGTHDMVDVAVGEGSIRIRTQPGTLRRGAHVSLTTTRFVVFDPATGAALAAGRSGP